MTRTFSSLCGVAFTVALLPAAAAMTASAPQSAARPQIIVAEYMRAVPAGPAGAQRCQRVCVKTGGATATHPAKCLQWKITC